MQMKIPYFSFAAGVIVGLILGAFFYSELLGVLPQERSPAPVTAATTTVPEGSGAISVTDQPAGESVLVESVTVTPPGVWVAVREAQVSSGGFALGYILGAVKVGGPRGNISVPLLRPTLPGAHYAVELYRDDAGGAFDPPRNSVFIDPDTGEAAISHFKTVTDEL